MSSTDVEKVTIPKKLLAVIKKYKNVDLNVAKERFTQFLEEYTLDGEEFPEFCNRLVSKGLFKKSFITALEETDFLEVDENRDTSGDAEDYVNDEDRVESDTDSDDIGDADSDADAVTETDQASDNVKASKGPDASAIKGLTGTHKFRAEYEDPTHAILTHKALEAVGFTVAMDERLGGDIVRKRGGKFVLDILVLDKKACKRRTSEAHPDGLGPVIAFTNKLVERYENAKTIILERIVASIV